MQASPFIQRPGNSSSADTGSSALSEIELLSARVEVAERITCDVMDAAREIDSATSAIIGLITSHYPISLEVHRRIYREIFPNGDPEKPAMIKRAQDYCPVVLSVLDYWPKNDQLYDVIEHAVAERIRYSFREFWEIFATYLTKFFQVQKSAIQEKIEDDPEFERAVDRLGDAIIFFYPADYRSNPDFIPHQVSAELKDYAQSVIDAALRYSKFTAKQS